MLKKQIILLLIVLPLFSQKILADNDNKSVNITAGLDSYIFSGERKTEFIPCLSADLSKGIWGINLNYRYQINHTMVSGSETISPEIHTAGAIITSGRGKLFQGSLKGRAGFGENDYSAISGAFEISACIKDITVITEGMLTSMEYDNENLEEKSITAFIQYKAGQSSFINLMAYRSKTVIKQSDDYTCTFFRTGVNAAPHESFFLTAGILYGYDSLDNSIPGFDAGLQWQFSQKAGINFKYQYTCYIPKDTHEEDETLSVSDFLHTVATGSRFIIPEEQNSPQSYHEFRLGITYCF